MFPQEPPVAGKSTPVDNNIPSAEDAMYYVDFGPFFGEEVRKVLQYRQDGMFCEIMFWQDEYRF